MNGAIKGMHHLLFWKADLNTHLSLYKEENGRITRSQTTSALHLAVEDDNLTMAKLLLRHGADPNAEFTDCTPLDVAVGRGNGAMTLLLLENGAKIRDKITLSRAIEHGGTMAWVEAGRCGEDYPFTEPEVAPNYDFRAVVLVLHLYGADLNQKSLLHDAVEHYGSLDDGVIELLLYLGADVHAKDERGGSAISRAFEGAYCDARRSKAFAQLLIAYGAEVKPEDLRDPVESAIYRGDIEDLELVLEYGGDVNSTCCEGPFLHLVITRDFFDDDTTQEGLLKLLLNWGADVLARDRDSRTPLEHAMLFPWKINLAKPLLDAGAKVQCHGKEGAQLLTYLIKDGLTSYFEEDPSTDSLRYEFQVRRTDSFRYKLQDYLEDMNDGRLRDPYDFSKMDAMIGLLLEYGVCPDYADDSGQCPLDLPGATLFSALQPWLSKRGKT